MSSVEKPQQIINSQQVKLKPQGTLQTIQPASIFSIQLTSSQANAINTLLPKSFILVINKLKTKRVFKKTFSLQKKSNKNVAQRSEKSSEPQKIQQHSQNPIQQTINNQVIKKCQKIFNALSKSKFSWPFREPVDPIAQGIPHYKQIIKNPMDLRTVGVNISQNKYITISQFYADIQLIINNSITFNKDNPQFLAITSEFQGQFQKLKGDSLGSVGRPGVKKVIMPGVANSSVKEKKKSQIRFIPDLKKRRSLTIKIKNLSREELGELINKLNLNQNNKQLNLEILPEQKVRFLQDYFMKRQLSQQAKLMTMKAKDIMKKPNLKEQSSFESSSDS